MLGINGILSIGVLLKSSQNIQGWLNMKKSKFPESEKITVPNVPCFCHLPSVDMLSTTPDSLGYTPVATWAQLSQLCSLLTSCGVV